MDSQHDGHLAIATETATAVAAAKLQMPASKLTELPQVPSCELSIIERPLTSLSQESTGVQSLQSQQQQHAQNASDNSVANNYDINHNYHPIDMSQSNAQPATTTTIATTPSNGQWMITVAAQTTNGMRQRMSQASDQFSNSLRQLYASASSITDQLPPSYQNIPGIVPYYHGRSSGPPPSYDDVINPYAAPPTYQSLFGQMREARKTSRGLVDLLRRMLIILISTLGCTILIAFMILIPFTMIIVGAIYIDECRIEHIPAFLLVGGLVWASKNILHCYSQCRNEQRQQQQLQQFDQQEQVATNETGAGNQEEHTQVAYVTTTTTTTTTTGSGTTSTAASPNGSQTNYQSSHQYQSGSTHRTYRLKSSICESLLNCILFGWFIAGCVIVFRNYEPDFENSSSLRYCNRIVYMYTFWLITSAILICTLFIGCICCLIVSSAIANRQEDDDLA